MDETSPGPSVRHNPAPPPRSGRPRAHRRAVGAAPAAGGVRLDRVRVVLVRPEHPFNIGQAARAMLNMGLTRLMLVEPPRAFRGSEARQGAAGAAWKVLKAAEAHADLDAALAGTVYSVAFTSGRGRDRIRPPLFDAMLDGLADASRDGDVALVFGSERDGLSTTEISACHAAARLAVSPEHPSLNLAQAVLLAAAGVFSFGREEAETPGPFAAGQPVESDLSDQGALGRGSGDTHDSSRPDPDPEAPAPHEAITGLHAHLWRLVERTRFPSKQNPDALADGVRRLIARAGLSVWEVQLMRGFLSHLEGVLDRAGLAPDAEDPGAGLEGARGEGGQGS